MKPNLNEMLKQVQKLQNDFQKFQDEFGSRSLTVEVGGGVVKVTINGKREITSIDISPEIITPDEKEMIEDLILSGVNKALREMNELYEQEMSKLTKGIIPPGLNIPGF